MKLILRLLKCFIRLLHSNLDRIYENIIGEEDSFPVAMAHLDNGSIQPGTIMAMIRLKELFQNLSLLKKMIALIKGMKLADEEVQHRSFIYLIQEVFGNNDDFGLHLFMLNQRIQSKKWDFELLNESDLSKAQAIASCSLIATRQLLENQTYPKLNLHMGLKNPMYCSITIPMTSIVLVQSIRFFIDVNCFYTFSSIRKSPHEYKDDLIQFLYEILTLQQKTSLSILEFHRKCAASQEQRKVVSIHLLSDDIFSIMGSDLIVSYLKATIEKLIAFIGIIFGVHGIETRKRHVQKVNLLNDKLKDKTKNTPYGQILLEYIKSENLEELNNYRTGILHKKGASRMQPHSYIGKESFDDLPMRELLIFFKHHHEMNSVVLLGSLAMLADSIMDIKESSGEDLSKVKGEMTELFGFVLAGVESAKKEYSL